MSLPLETSWVWILTFTVSKGYPATTPAAPETIFLITVVYFKERVQGAYALFFYKKKTETEKNHDHNIKGFLKSFNSKYNIFTYQKID